MFFWISADCIEGKTFWDASRRGKLCGTALQLVDNEDCMGLILWCNSENEYDEVELKFYFTWLLV